MVVTTDTVRPPMIARASGAYASLPVPSFAAIGIRPIMVASDVMSDTYQVLLSLGHSELESRELIDDALAGKKKYKDVESLIQAIYDKKSAN